MSERTTVWVCGACGRARRKRDEFTDESCFLNAVEVWEDTIQFAFGRAVSAIAVGKIDKVKIDVAFNMDDAK